MTSDLSVVIDGHVHFYECFRPRRFLDAAVENFARQAGETGTRAPHQVLLLSEAAGCHWFQRLLEATGSPGSARAQALAPWRVTVVPEDPLTLRAADPEGREILIVAGRQVVTDDRIEVLTLVTDAVLPDGLTLERTLERAANSEAVPVLPWGVGKWLGRRGQRLKQVIADPPVPLLVGDITGRPWVWPTPGLLRAARDRGVRLLPGSDPLPLAGEESQVGSSGAIAAWPRGVTQPSQALRQILMSREVALQPFGRRETLPRFLTTQLRLRLPGGRTPPRQVP